jgi:hypothetical protein
MRIELGCYPPKPKSFKLQILTSKLWNKKKQYQRSTLETLTGKNVIEAYIAAKKRGK